MKTLLRLLCVAAFLASAHAPAQVVVSGTVAVGGGGAFLDGDRASFQQNTRHHKDGFGGIEEFSVTRLSDDSLLRLDASASLGDADYRFTARWEKFDTFFIEASLRKFRIFYDGSGGYLRPRDFAFPWFDEDLALDRTFFSVELGTLLPDRPQWRLRYEHNTREGTKNSLRWGDSNLAGQPFSPRGLIPAYLAVDEVREVFSADISQQTEQANWKLGGRFEHTELNNRHVGRRRAFEAQDRYVTTYDGTQSDIFSGHGFYERIVNERLRVSAGGFITSIDSALAGSRIYGESPNAAYNATYARRQNGDIGFYGLAGNAHLRQHLANLNVVFDPIPGLSIRPSLRYERLQLVAGESHTDTDWTGATSNAALRPVEASNRNQWNEVVEDLELRCTRLPDLTLSARVQLNQGTGNLVEQSILLPNRTAIIDRDTDYERLGQRYSVAATWYLRPGLTLAADANRRIKTADYKHLRDSTSNATPTSRDRYPAYIVDQDIDSRDVGLRLSWRPWSVLSLVTRYAYQNALLDTSFDGLGEIRSGELRRHVITQSALWHPTARLYLSGAAHLSFDQLAVPEHRLTMKGENNYLSGNLSAGYALGKVDDLHVDFNHHRAANYQDNSTVTLPLNMSRRVQSGFLTWVHRHSDRLATTLRYGFAINRDIAFAGLNDYTAHLVYGKVQYAF